MSIPSHCIGLVYDPRVRRLELREVPLRPLRAGEALVRVSLSSICRSDLHTIQGRRDPGGPLILGHEACGTVVCVGDGVEADARGARLSLGDRVTWSIAASCGSCFLCDQGIPQKCASLFKYGHETLAADPPLSGGFAEYCYLVPGTAIYKLPADLPDEAAVFANCAVATAAAIARTTDVQPGESVMIQGAGLLGLCVSAFCAERGAGTIAVTDVSPERLRLAGQLGATHAFLVGDDRARPVPEHGYDVAVEVCGKPEVIPDGVEALRIGGRYIIAGCVFPGATVGLDLQRVIVKLLTLTGLHNYRPEDLEAALRLLTETRGRYPFEEVVDSVYPLERFEEALTQAESGLRVLRVALKP